MRPAQPAGRRQSCNMEREDEFMPDEAASRRVTAGDTRVFLSVRINGEGREIPVGSTVAHVIESLGRQSRAVAVELNGSIVRRERYDHVAVQDGDHLEIVQFVQGG